MNYKPEKLDLDKIKLSKELQDIVEKLAINQHKIWARNKIKSGYEYGEEHSEPKYRNGKLVKKGAHPDLIPYQELSEEKKDYDRSNVIITIKGLIAEGFKIESKH